MAVARIPCRFVRLAALLAVTGSVRGEQEPVYELPDYTVTAWHFEEPELDVPASVTVIRRELIERSGATSVPELLVREANVEFRSFNGKAAEGELSLRGFGENSGLRVLVLVDGLKANRPDLGNIEWQQIPVSEIESIEVVRGGQNVLYGDHALSGVVKITTRRDGDAGGRLAVTAGQFGFVDAALSGQATAGPWYGGAGFNYQWDEGYRDNSLSWARTLSARLGRRIGKSDTVTARASVGRSYLQFPGPITGYDAFIRDPRRSENDGSEESESDNGRLTVRWEGDREWGAIEAGGGLSRREFEWNLSGVRADNTQTGLSLAPRVRIGGEADFVLLGYDFFADEVLFDDYLDPALTLVRGSADLDRIKHSPYLFARRNLRPGLALSGGVRWEHSTVDGRYDKFVESQLPEFVDTIIGPLPNPDFKRPPDLDPALSFDDRLEQSGWAAEVSVNWRLRENWSLWTGYDRVYRYPVLDEIAAYQGAILAQPFNLELDPETGDNFEAGLKYRGQRWELSLTGFLLLMQDEIAFTVDPGTGLGANANIGDTRRIGGEMELRYTGGWWGASTAWSLVDARFNGGPVDGNRVPLVPWANGVSSLWWQPADGLRLTGFLRVLSDRYQGGDELNRQRQLDPYGLVDLRLNFRLDEGVELVLSVDNLFDTTYASTAFNDGYYPGPGRFFRAGLGWNF